MLNTNKIFLKNILATLLALMTIACSRNIKVDENKLSTIKTGFTKEQVIHILGKPLEVNEYEFKTQLRECWTYSQIDIAATNQQVIFDAAKDTVIEVIHLE